MKPDTASESTAWKSVGTFFLWLVVLCTLSGLFLWWMTGNTDVLAGFATLPWSMAGVLLVLILGNALVMVPFIALMRWRDRVRKKLPDS